FQVVGGHRLVEDGDLQRTGDTQHMGDGGRRELDYPVHGSAALLLENAHADLGRRREVGGEVRVAHAKVGNGPPSKLAWRALRGSTATGVEVVVVEVIGELEGQGIQLAVGDA